MSFKYFRDPDNFSFKMDSKAKCAICDRVGLWFDGDMYCGENEIECICDSCLSEGKLIPLDISTNMTESEDGNANQISYCTPCLPCWQDQFWPFVDGDYCIFEKVASQKDFTDKHDFEHSFSKSEKEHTDLDWLWNMMPETAVQNLKDGAFDVCVYIFTRKGKKFCTWDCN